MIKVRASQIFSHAVEDAVAAKKQLDQGAPFSEVVEKYSTCPSKKNGGDLGWMPEGELQSLMGQTVSEKDKDKIIGPVHSQYGYHILKITEIEIENVDGGFTPDTPMSEANQLFPEVHTALFKQFHIGLPVTGYKPEETLASVCKTHGKNVLEVLSYLNTQFLEKQVAVISPGELKEKINSGDKNLTLLDIRETWERDIARIEGSQLVTRENFEDLLNSLSKDREIVIIDWKQDRAPSFHKWVSQKGFKNVKFLEGGIDAWAEKIETQVSRYDIDEDDGYRYEDITEENPDEH